MNAHPVYLDNHATTQPDPRVLSAIWEFFTTRFGNAGSATHRFGWEAREAVEQARERVARGLGADPQAILFTSGATESNNLAILGALPARKSRGNHLVTSAIEHPSVLGPLKRLAREGWRLTILAPDRYGWVRPESVAEALTDQTVLVSIMAANHEIGTIQPIREIGRICRDRGILFHTDATQAVGKVPIDVEADGIDLLSLSAHKVYGPKGIGALYVRRGDGSPRLVPLLDGGGQERGLRSGTVAVPLVVGLGLALELAAGEMPAEQARLAELRDRLQARLADRVAGVQVNGHPTDRLAGNLNVSIPGIVGEALPPLLLEIAVSSGSACTSEEKGPSRVLRAIGVPEDLATASLRFGLGRFNTVEEVDFAADVVAEAVARLRRAGGS